MSAPSPLRTIALALAAALAVTLTACSSDALQAAPAAGSPTQAASATSSSGNGAVRRIRLAENIDHGHGLVVTADGSLLVGTHTGIVKVGPDGGTAGGPSDICAAITRDNAPRATLLRIPVRAGACVVGRMPWELRAQRIRLR